MKLPNTAHTARPWRVHEITRDFRLEDVWALPTPGGPDGFREMVQVFFASADPSGGPSRAARTLWAIRSQVGAQLGWDGADGGRDPGQPTLRDRLPPDLCNTLSSSVFNTRPFVPLYLTDDEFAAELVNRIVHAVMHLSWVPDRTGGYRGQMAVYVKPNGPLGVTYMAAIKPFRYLIVYPALMQMIGRGWRERDRLGTEKGERR